MKNEVDWDLADLCLTHCESTLEEMTQNTSMHHRHDMIASDGLIDGCATPDDSQANLPIDHTAAAAGFSHDADDFFVEDHPELSGFRHQHANT